MRPKKMALWNEFLTSIQETTKPTTSTTSSCMSTSTSKPEDNKGIAIKPKKLNTPKASQLLVTFFLQCVLSSFTYAGNLICFLTYFTNSSSDWCAEANSLKNLVFLLFGFVFAFFCFVVNVIVFVVVVVVVVSEQLTSLMSAKSFSLHSRLQMHHV